MISSIFQSFKLISLVMIDLLKLLDLFDQFFLPFFISLHKIFQLNNFVHFLKPLYFSVKSVDLQLVLLQLVLGILKFFICNFYLVVDRHISVLFLCQNLLCVYSIKHSFKSTVELFQFVSESVIQVLELLQMILFGRVFL